MDDVILCEKCGCEGNETCLYPPKDGEGYNDCSLNECCMCVCCQHGIDRMTYRPGEDGQLTLRDIRPLEILVSHQSQLKPSDNKFHKGNGEDGKHYWLTPPDLYAHLDAEFHFDFDPCPYPKPEDFDGLTCEWGQSNYVNPPFGSILHQGPNDKKPKKKGPTAWMRKAIEESKKGKRVVIVYPVDKWVLMMMQAIGAKNVRNLGDVRWCATEDGSQGKGTGRHIAAFILDGQLTLNERKPS